MKLTRYRAWPERHTSVWTSRPSSPRSAMRLRHRTWRPARTSGGSSCRSHSMRPRFMGSSLRNKQLAFDGVETDAAGLGDQERVAEDHVPREREIRIRVRDQRHPDLGDRWLVFEQRRTLIGVKPEMVAANPRVLARRVLPEPLALEDAILGQRHLGHGHAGAEDVEGRLLRAQEDVERLLLHRARLPHDERPADLRVVPADLRSDFRNDDNA